LRTPFIEYSSNVGYSKLDSKQTNKKIDEGAIGSKREAFRRQMTEWLDF